MKTTATFPKHIALLVCCLVSATGFSQQWSWVSGDSTFYSPGDYASYWSGVGSATPGSRHGSATWTDHDGNLWLFGGFGFDINDENGYLGDLWEFDLSINRWKLVSGHTIKNQYSVYGTKGVPSPHNQPSGRYNALSWVDHSGNFWLYGGTESLQGTAIGVATAELWKYDPHSNQWTFVGGRTEYIYDPPDLNLCFGTMGVEAATNEPLGRNVLNNPAWVDQENNLWFYDHAELWRYNISTDRWTWMGGGDIVNNTYVPKARHSGQKGVPHPDNCPGDRNYPATFTDPNGDLWLYGGFFTGAQNVYPDGLGYLGDLWKYSVQDATWTWMQGDSTLTPAAVFGIMGQAAPANTPGARGQAACWVDSTGNFWLFGGSLWEIQNGETFGFRRNDVWKYDPGTNEWTWIKGPSAYFDNGFYQELRVPGDPKRPSARGSSVRWNNDMGLWIFGGSPAPGLFGPLNDLWCFGCDSLHQSFHEPGFEMANVFTPNGDGINDAFRPVRTDGYTIRDFSIINRWGEVVFRAIDSPNPWNGTVLGTPAAEGVYFWRIQVESYTGEVTNESGFVTLIRN
jgi:gliding motility-associated-like protein